MTYTDIIAKAMQIAPLSIKPESVSARCAITGADIEVGYRIEALKNCDLTDSLLPGNAGWISESAARIVAGQLPNSKGKMVSAMWNKGSLICFESGAFYWPLQSPESAERDGRIAWRDAIPLAWERHQGEACAIVAATDVKKAVWPLIGTIGATPLSRATGIVFHVSGVMTGARFVDWQVVCDLLSEIAAIRRAGFSRVDNKLAWPLWPGSLALDTVAYAAVGRRKLIEAQQLIEPHIGSPELLLACLAEGYSLKNKD